MFQRNKKQSSPTITEELLSPMPEKKNKKTWEDILCMFGERSRIAALLICYVLFVFLLFLISIYQTKRVLSIQEADLQNKESEMSVVAYLAPESRTTLMVEKTNDDILEFSCERDEDKRQENIENLQNLMAELEDGNSKKFTVDWTPGKRRSLKQSLSERLIKKWIDLSNMGILQTPIYGDSKDGWKLANTKVNIQGDTDPVPATELLSKDQMIDLMISNVDVWGDERDSYQELFQKIISPTLKQLVPVTTPQAMKTPRIVESGKFLLKKGYVPSREEIDLFKAYQKKLESKSHWGHDILLLIMLILSIVAFRRLLFRKRANDTLANLYSYFPMLAIFLGLFMNVLAMAFVLIIEAQFPLISDYFPLKYLYVIFPMLLPTMLISLIYHYDAHVALFAGLFNAVIFASANFSGMHSALLMGLASTFITGIFATKIKDDRSSRMYTFICHFSSAILTLALLSGFEWHNGSELINSDYLWQLGYVVCAIIIASVVVSFFLAPVCVFIMELFGADTRIIYNNLSNQSNKVMKELAKEAPGTYYHCVKVANMAVFAAEQMSSDYDPTAIYACAMYHDIGKLAEPKVYTENGGDLDKLDLTYMEKAEKIRQHVTSGVKFAKKHHFPHLIIEVIRTHHGADSISYFYQKAKEVGEIDPNDPVQAEKFHYEGPNPETPEAFLIGMADACEAAVKSMREKFTEESITNMVNKVFEKRREAHFMENANVKIGELKIMKRAFVEHLMGEVKRLNYENKLGKTESPEKKS